ncbi:MAG: DUF4271 domain-containing protein [Cytophagales bacterium]|nr:DUF4271 domain-containing protein [Cytophagales bacterium]
MVKAKYQMLVVFLVLFNSNSLIASDFLVEEDLRLSWVFYDEHQNVMLPFLDNSNKNPVSIHLRIDQDYGNEAYLMVEIPENSSLFIEDKFIEHFEDHTEKYFSIDSIRNQLSVTSIHFTLYNKHRLYHPAEAKIGFIHQSFDSEIDVNPIALRTIEQTSDFLKIVFLLVFTFFVILYSLFKSDLFDFLSLRTLFTFRYTETALFKYRSLTKTQTLVIVYLAALSASVFIIFLYYYDNPKSDSWLVDLNPLFGWFILFMIVLLSIFLKFILISVISFLFKIGEKINFYLVEFLRMSMIFYSVMFVIVSYTVINHFYYIETLLENLIVIVIAFNLIRFVMLFFKFRKTVNMKSLHLFSYLCTTELIPIVLGFKFFLK